MKEVIKLFKQIQETSGKNDKINIVKANADNELFKKCLVFLLDTNIVTGISKKKLSKKFLAPQNVILVTYTFEDVMEYLKANNTGRDEDIVYVQQFLSVRPKEDLWFYEGMITKTLKIGMDKKSANLAIPNLVANFQVQLGTAIDHVKLTGDEWISLSHKLNGTRVAFVNGELFTRQGKKYTGLHHIINDLHRLALDNMFIDGELVYKNKEGLTDSEAFQKGTGIANSKNETKEELKLVIFDMFPVEEFLQGKSKDKYSVRYYDLKRLEERIKDELDTDNLEVVKNFYRGYDHSQIWKWLDYAEENDLEGIMINLDAPYECKRNKNLIKVKKFYTMDLPIVDVLEGDGKLKGVLGSFVVQYKDNLVKVGSGFSDTERQLYWDNRDELIGRVAEVKYKEITKDKKTEKESLQFPIFFGIREMGKEVSYD